MPGLKGPAYTPLRGAKAAKAAYYHRATLVANDKGGAPACYVPAFQAERHRAATRQIT
jgi:hypothetical protein